VGAGAGEEGAGDDGAGVGVDGAGELPLELLGFGSFFCFWDGSEPDGENDVSSGAAPTLTGVTADGAAALSSFFAVALPMPNATPNATTTAATAIAAKRPAVMRPGRCRRA
jgi:hypothetical protein